MICRGGLLWLLGRRAVVIVVMVASVKAQIELKKELRRRKWHERVLNEDVVRFVAWRRAERKVKRRDVARLLVWPCDMFRYFVKW